RACDGLVAREGTEVDAHVAQFAVRGEQPHDGRQVARFHGRVVHVQEALQAVAAGAHGSTCSVSGSSAGSSRTLVTLSAAKVRCSSPPASLRVMPSLGWTLTTVPLNSCPPCSRLICLPP